MGETLDPGAEYQKRDKFTMLSEDIRELIDVIKNLNQTIAISNQQQIQNQINEKLNLLLSGMASTVHENEHAPSPKDRLPHDHLDEATIDEDHEFIERLEKTDASTDDTTEGPDAGRPPELAIEFEPDNHTDGDTDLEPEAYESVKPYPNSQPLLFEEEIIDNNRANAETIFENSPNIDDTSAYRQWVDSVLLKLSRAGLSNSQICAEMMKRDIRTPKGKEKWYPVGVHAMLNHIKLKQEEAGANGEVEDHAIQQDKDPDEPAIPTWQDEEYRKYTRDMIFKMRAEGNTLRSIAEKLTQMGIKTRKGGEKWSFSSVNGILKNE